MLNKILLIAVFAGASLLSSCGEDRILSAEAYLQYMNEHAKDFICEKKIGNILFRLKYQPVEYQAAQQIVSKEIKSAEELKSFIANKKDLKYFVLEIENARAQTDLLSENITQEGELLQRTNYYSYEFEKDIHLMPGNDTLSCALFHYENSYGGTPVLRFMTAFDDKSKGTTGEFIVSDRIFNKGTIKFKLEDAFADAKIPEVHF